jgi:hypothetical protein
MMSMMSAIFYSHLLFFQKIKSNREWKIIDMVDMTDMTARS